MTVQTAPQYPGVGAVGRKRVPSAGSPDYRMPVGGIGTPSVPAFASLSVGKRGQIMMVDDIEIFGKADQSKLGTGGSFVVLRKDRYDGNIAGLFDMPFMVHSFNATNNTVEWFNWHIEKVGYAAKHFTDASVELERANAMGVLNFVNAEVADIECNIRARYMGQQDSERIGCRRGLWGASDGLTSGQTLLAAPGAGLHYRIRTIMVVANGSANTDELALLAGGTIKKWHSFGTGNESRVVQWLTDIDIPCPENTAVTLTFPAGLIGRHSFVIGAEIAQVDDQNFRNLTGAPE